MKVYILEGIRDDEPGAILGVYTDRDGAQREQDRRYATGPWKYDAYIISEHEVVRTQLIG